MYDMKNDIKKEFENYEEFMKKIFPKQFKKEERSKLNGYEVGKKLQKDLFEKHKHLLK